MSDSLGKAACIIADEINAAAIVTFTSSTTTAKNVAKYRPRVPIIGLTDDLRVHRRLNFVWGVRSVLVQTVDNDLLIPDSFVEDLLQLDIIKPDDNLVFVSGLSRGNIREQNMIKIFKVPAHDY
jgi:pyruvate kinase